MISFVNRNVNYINKPHGLKLYLYQQFSTNNNSSNSSLRSKSFLNPNNANNKTILKEIIDNNPFTQYSNNNLVFKRIYSTHSPIASSPTNSTNTQQQNNNVDHGSTTILNSTTTNTTNINENHNESPHHPPPETQTPQKPEPKGLMKYIRGPYMTLIKFPITVYVTLTAVAGYVAACPVGSFDWIHLAQVTVGTFFASCSANIHNQEMEVQHDRKMPRTKDRPLVVGSINRGKAWLGSMALLTLGFGTMAITPSLFIPGTLAACNILLYCWYTDLKRVTPLNTWVGAVVGAIPPLIGSVAATGQFEAIGMLLASFLYIWQIPHFLALSQVLREQYRMAGYQMLSVTHPKQFVDRVSLAHAFFGIPLPFIFDYVFNFNVHPITLAVMSLGSASLALPFFVKTSPKRLYIISLISLPLTLILSCVLSQPYIYVNDDEDDEEKNKIKEISN
ncbi:hypothetical protein DICPUDRAFT_81366 [Dictyostelium purpureum]|uniref:Heme O synthase n=1 Tax=Dictyostelium purpureum TaxID=5786 RepID=F0ZT97_DICPU|nr:uncharacterized protein DICPUDRAFT_81366 [Dictyostelium purpureum]EGC32817.1 hypothetical protein DICPUDRAFT_81366 [Dictyostelium purpureum]|eukprot:XP_003290640.1 hypothetical protein DICPUDRAFT_81366 [Dictyostelium purpureum]